MVVCPSQGSLLVSSIVQSINVTRDHSIVMSQLIHKFFGLFTSKSDLSCSTLQDSVSTRSTPSVVDISKRHDSGAFDEDSLFPVVTDAPLLKLPVEVVQEIASYLPRESAASFCLSSSYICYAIGTEQLHAYLKAALSKIQKRANLQIVERAFPSHWYCPWCDVFHKHETAGGPKNFAKETKRDCAEFNSFLRAGNHYVLAYHHVRMAMNRHSWGPDYGIGLEEFSYQQKGSNKILNVSCPANMDISTRIVANKFLLNVHYAISVPISLTKRSEFYQRLWASLPQIVVGHRNDRDGHNGMLYDIQHSTSNFWKSDVDVCKTCATDYAVSAAYPQVEATESCAGVNPKNVEIVIEVWRDLGNGKSPFDTQWRAHGENVTPYKANIGDSLWLAASHKPGCIKEAFEKGAFPVSRVEGFGNVASRTTVCKPLEVMWTPTEPPSCHLEREVPRMRRCHSTCSLRECYRR